MIHQIKVTGRQYLLKRRTLSSIKACFNDFSASLVSPALSPSLIFPSVDMGESAIHFFVSRNP